MSNLERPYNILIAKAGVTHDATDVASLAEGEIAIVGNDFNVVAAGETISDHEYIYIVQGTASGDAPKFSAKIKGASVKKYSGSSYAAPNEQVTFIGSNGSDAGDIEGGTVVNGEEYSLHVVIKGFDKDLYSERQLRKSFHFTADGSATEEEVRDGLFNAIVADPMFKDVAIAKVGALIEVSKTTHATSYGIKLEGLAQTAGAYDEYEQVFFEIGLDKGFTSATRISELGYVYLNGAAPVADASAAPSEVPSQGVGTYAKVKDLEEFAQGFQGITNKTGFPIPAYPKYAVAGETYDLYVIDHVDVHASGDLEQSISSPLQTIVAIPVSLTAATTLVEGILNPYMASAPGAFAPVLL